MTVGERIKRRRKQIGITADALGEAIGRSRATIYKYEKGDIENLSHTLLIPLAKALRTTPEYLLGYEDDPEDYEDWLNDAGYVVPDSFYPELDDYDRARKYFEFKKAEEEDALEYKQQLEREHGSNVSILNLQSTVKVPVYGTVPAGVPVEALQDLDGYVDIPADWANHGTYIGLTVSGCSMYPKYLEGDTVVIKLQDHAANGQDAVVYVNGYDATLKTVINEPDGTTTLKPVNPEYQTKNYKPGVVKVLGVVKRMIREM